MTYTIYHNSRCSKSRQTLALLEQHGIHPEVIEYLKVPLTTLEVLKLAEQLAMSVSDLIRAKESVFKDLGLKLSDLSDQQVAELIAEHPVLLERPVVVCGNRAVVGRPPENVLDLL